MLNFKKLLKQEKQIWFKVGRSDKIKFLTFLKDQNVKWVDGKEIDVKKDKISSFMGVTENLELGFVSAMCWCSSEGNTRKKYHINDFFMEGLNV